MKLIQNFIKNNRCFTKPIKIAIKKLVLHSTGVAQPSSDGMIARMNTVTAQTSVHGFIEADKVIQTLPWNLRGWHVGSGKKGSYNSCAIGVEICEPSWHTYNGGTMIGYDVKKNAEYFAKVYENAVELFARLCHDNNLDPIKDIVCHSEAFSLGYGSNHSDVIHWFPKHGKSMDIFRVDVKARLLSNVTPDNSITVDSSPNDIKWLQSKINEVVGGVYGLSVDGDYGNKTRIAVLIFWESLGWNKDGKDDGWKIGKSTIEELNK